MNIKDGLDYFIIEKGIINDPKMEIVEAEHGNTGFAIYIKLLLKIYDKGYYLHFPVKARKVFARKQSLDFEGLEKIILTMLEEKLFSEKVFMKYEILTSVGIQKRFLAVTKRRKQVVFFKQLLLLNRAEIQNVNNDALVVNINNDKCEHLAVEMLHLGVKLPVKESKVKESKGKQSKEYCPAIFLIIINHLNQVAGTSYKWKSKKTQDLIKARMNEGFSVEDFFTVHHNKAADWKKDDNFSQFLRPITLYSNKFESYLNRKKPSDDW